MGNIGSLRHKGKIIHNIWSDNGYGGQSISSTKEYECYIAIKSSNGKEIFQTDGIFNVKTLQILIRSIDSHNVTAGDKIKIDSELYDINNVELYEKDRNYYLLYVSKQVIAGD